MQIPDIINQVYDSIEQGKAKSSANLYADNFTFTGPVPMAVNKDQWLDLISKITSGVPDWNFHRREMRVEGQTVVSPVQITGTQTQTLPSLMPGMPDLPATNRSFQLPPEVAQITIQGDRIVKWHVDPVPGGGVLGMLEQLGVSIPVTGKPGDVTHSTPS